MAYGDVVMSKEGEFLIYCIEMYMDEKNLNGKQVVDLFKEHKVMEYIMSFYEALHTTGDKYIINDIDLFLKAHA